MAREIDHPITTRRRTDTAVEAPGQRPVWRRALTFVPLDPDPYYRAWLARRTLASWRAADEVLRRSESSPARDAHERAVAVALDHLAEFSSVDELVAHHAADRYRRVTDMGEPPNGTVECWAAEACQPVEGGPVLDQSLVIGAAFWRRAQQLIGTSAE